MEFSRAFCCCTESSRSGQPAKATQLLCESSKSCASALVPGFAAGPAGGGGRTRQAAVHGKLRLLPRSQRNRRRERTKSRALRNRPARQRNRYCHRPHSARRPLGKRHAEILPDSLSNTGSRRISAFAAKRGGRPLNVSRWVYTLRRCRPRQTILRVSLRRLSRPGRYLQERRANEGTCTSAGPLLDAHGGKEASHRHHPVRRVFCR